MIVNLKTNYLLDIHDEKGNRQDAVVQSELGKRFAHRSYKRKTMTISNVAGDVECDRKTGKDGPNNEEAHKVDFIQVFRIKKKVRDTQVFAKVACDHGN